MTSNVRELSNLKFSNMVVNLADSEVEETFVNGTTKVIYFLKGEEIGVAFKKEDQIVKCWQILNNPFGSVKSGLPYELWNEIDNGETTRTETDTLLLQPPRDRR